MRIAGQILIALILFWAHWHLDHQSWIVKTTSYQGILPVTDHSLPLSADDIVRGLQADPTISFDKTTFEKAYTLRQEFAREKASRDSLEWTLGEQTSQLIRTMEDTK